jgi:hypothetical protein
MEAEQRAVAKLEKDREERGVADELAGAMNEFFAALYVDDLTAGYDDLVSGEAGLTASSTNDLPLASPDSITVTTEFGVLEETGNVTIISAMGPSPHHHAFDNTDTEEENNVEMTEDLNDDLPELQQDLSALVQVVDVASQPQPQPMALQADMQDLEVDLTDAGEEADIDTDDFEMDAESAIIEEFMDDDEDEDEHGGLLTPTATVTT